MTVGAGRRDDMPPQYWDWGPDDGPDDDQDDDGRCSECERCPCRCEREYDND